MPFSELLIYIRNEIQVNTPKEKIVEHLLLSGYARADIDRALNEVEHTPDMGQRAVFSDIPSASVKNVSVFGWFVSFILINILAFAAFSFLYNSVSLIPAVPLVEFATSSVTINYPGSIFKPTSTSTLQVAPMPDVPAPAAPTGQTNSVAGISSDDRDQIIAAIITQATVFDSGNAANVRNYLEITASPQYKQQLDAMSDSAILSLASTLTAGGSYVDVNSLNSVQTTWVRTSETSVQVTIQTPHGPVSRTSNEANSVWY